MYQFTPDQPNMWVSPSPGYDPPRAPEALVIAAVAAGLIGTCCLCLAASSVLAGIPLAAIAKSTRDAVAQQASAAPTMTAAMARLSATATVQAYWPLVISDTFDDNENGWRVGNASDNFADTSWTISGGAYHWTLAAHRSVHWFIVPDLPALSVFRAGVTAVSSGQTANAEYGLVFRHADNDN